jgi:hypothetical protein
MTTPSSVTLTVPERLFLVRLVLFLAACFAALLLVGCQVQERPPGTVSGVVNDLNGGVVRGATVQYRGRNTAVRTTTNSAGAFVLENVASGESLITAEIVKDGIRYFGQNVVTVIRDQQTKSLVITIARENQLAGIRGAVFDRFGNRLAGARVFADMGGILGSAMAISDDQGNYELWGLIGGAPTTIVGTGRGYNSDPSRVTLTAGNWHTFNFTLNQGTSPTLPAPQDLEAIAWTSPRQATRSPQERMAIEAVKRELDPKREERFGAQLTRLFQGGNWIEVDLTWEPVDSVSLLGYGIYRGTNQAGALTAVDFLRDPLTYFFADLDPDLVEGVNYYYEVTALNVLFPDTPNSESEPSNRFGVRALGDLTLRSPILQPLQFRWNAAREAERYMVFLYDRFPGIGVTSIWNNSANPTTGTSVAGPGGLQSGRRYYYIVIGLGNFIDGTWISRTISPVGEFVAP